MSKVKEIEQLIAGLEEEDLADNEVILYLSDLGRVTMAVKSSDTHGLMQVAYAMVAVAADVIGNLLYELEDEDDMVEVMSVMQETLIKEIALAYTTKTIDGADEEGMEFLLDSVSSMIDNELKEARKEHKTKREEEIEEDVKILH